MDVGLVPLWITSVFSAMGVMYAIIRNGSRSRKQDEQLKSELVLGVKSINKQLEDPENGLSAIKKSVDDQRLHCAKVSTAIAAQTKTNTDEIALLRKG